MQNLSTPYATHWIENVRPRELLRVCTVRSMGGSDGRVDRTASALTRNHTPKPPMRQRVGGIRLPAVTLSARARDGTRPHRASEVTKLGQVGIGAPNSPIHPPGRSRADQRTSPVGENRTRAALEERVKKSLHYFVDASYRTEKHCTSIDD